MSSAASGARYVLAVDVGGTFTDVIRHDTETGAVEIAKTASTPPDFIDGMLAGIDAVGAEPRDIKLIKVGTTIATNTVIMRTGARTALVTTAGFTDVLHAARRGPAHALRFRLGPGACAGRPTRHHDRRPAHDLRRRGAGAARRGGLARRRGAAPRARCRGGGGELPPQLHQRCPRAPRAGNPDRRDAGPATSAAPPTSCPRSASSSAPARPSPTPISARCWSAISPRCSPGWKASATTGRSSSPIPAAV